MKKEMREEKYTEYKRAIWPNYIEYYERRRRPVCHIMTS